MQVLDQIRQSILKNHPEWSTAKAEDIQIARMTGITNQTYKAWIDGQKYRPIIYRKFGQTGQNPFLERDSEIHVYKDIAKAGFGPSVYYFDEKIRIEQFIESTVLPAKEMLKRGRLEQVAFNLRKFHQLKPESPEIKKQSLFDKIFVKGEAIVGSCHKKMAQPIYTPEEEQMLANFKKWISPEEVEFITKVTEPYEGELVFSHNDLLANNILIDASGKTVFIDYEYGCYNYPIFDIANYFNETQIDYDVLEPPFFSIIPPKPEDSQNQKRFIEAYVVAKDLTLEQFRENFETLRKQEKYQVEINKIISDLPLGRMLSSVMWGWWGVLVCKNPLINFDYLAFSKWRYDQYYTYKAQLLK